MGCGVRGVWFGGQAPAAEKTMSTASAISHAAITLPAIVIMMHPERTCAPLRRTLHGLVPRLRCLRATRKDDVHVVSNGTARVSVGASSSLVHYHFPPVHPLVFNVGPLEIAILLSHLRALRAGLATGGVFVVFEEDAEWTMLLATPHAGLSRLVNAMPRQWRVLQAAVIAEPPYLRHLHRRLATAAARPRRPHHHHRNGADSSAPPTAPIVPRASLRGLSWPFTTGRAVVENQTWLKPYWSAALYVMSPHGATHLLERYWPRYNLLEPRHLGYNERRSPRAKRVATQAAAAATQFGPSIGDVLQSAEHAPSVDGALSRSTERVIDTRSQRWPAADQLLFNTSGAYLTTPLLTQPITGAHAEHMSYKRGARDFVFDTWRRGWRSLKGRQLTSVPLSMYILHSPFMGLPLTTRSTPVGTAADSISCHEAPPDAMAAVARDLPAHTRVEARTMLEAITHAIGLATETSLGTATDVVRGDQPTASNAAATAGTVASVAEGAPTHALLVYLPLLAQIEAVRLQAARAGRRLGVEGAKGGSAKGGSAKGGMSRGGSGKGSAIRAAEEGPSLVDVILRAALRLVLPPTAPINQIEADIEATTRQAEIVAGSSTRVAASTGSLGGGVAAEEATAWQRLAARVAEARSLDAIALTLKSERAADAVAVALLVKIESAPQVLRALQSTSADAARVEGTQHACSSHALGDAVAALQRHALRVGHSDAQVDHDATA